MFKNSRLLAALALLTLPVFSPCRAADAPPAASLISNGDFETDANADQWPDDWGRLKVGGSWEKDGDNHFLRMIAEKPGQMVMEYREIKIPANTGALELTWRQRITGLKVGKQAWFDARIMLDVKDAQGNKLKAPPAPYARKDSDGWVEKSAKFLVPEGATTLVLMPTLFQVQAGTFDLDDIALKPAEAAPLEEAAQAKAAANAEKQTKVAAARQAKAAANSGPEGELLPNGDFQADQNGDNVPDQWSALKDNLSWEKEGDNRFLRLTSPAPDKLVLFYREIDLPAATKALELKWKQRTSNLKPGKQAWFDARIMMNFKDAAGKQVNPGPSPPYTRGNSAGWVEKSTRFLVPQGAVTLVFMPTLFQVASGTYDLDDLSLKPTDPAALEVAAAKAAEEAKFINVAPEAPNPAKWPQELHVAGNKVLAKDGKEVWLQGVNIDSLEWNPKGERVLRSELVAVDEWKANVLRLPVKEEFWFGKEAGQTDGGAAYRALVDAVVNLAANRGAYVLLDLHRFRAPKADHVAFWKDAATRYKDHPAVLFDLFNEPHGISWEVWRNGGFVEDKDAPADEDAFLTPEEKAKNTKGFHSVGIQALVDAVRGTGAKNIVVAGGLDWAYDLSGIAKGFALDDKGGNGIVYATHIYAGKRDWQGKVLVVADKYPLIVSEVGANTKKFTFIPAEAQEDAATWVPRVLGFIQKHKLHWTAFSFHPGSAPVMITGWDYTPTPEWGALAKRALAGEQFPFAGLR